MTQEQIEQMEEHPLDTKVVAEERTFTNLIRDFVKIASQKYPPEEGNKKIELRPYQADILKNTLELLKKKGVAAIEAFCSAGKTIIGFMVIAYFLHHNPNKHVLFISPNKTAFDHFENDARKVLHNTWGFDCEYDVGGVFDYSKKIHIKTHFEVVREFRNNTQDFHTMMENTSIIVVDEVHRFPEEDENKKQTVYIGKLPGIIKGCVKSYGVKLMMMTGTHFRMDEQNPFGVEKVDFRISMQELIRLGYIPELRGSVLIVGKLEEGLKVNLNGKDIRIDSKDPLVIEALMRHYVRLAGLFMDVQKKDPTASHVVFAYNCEVAEDICREINKQLGWEGMVVMTSKSGTIASRKILIDKLNAGKYIGFVTVDVGSESINIPRLKYCHLMSKTRSGTRIGQRSGRICRPFPGKEWVACVDYLYQKESILRCAKGLADLYEMGSDGTDPTKFKDIPLTAPLYTRNNAPRKAHKELLEVVENNLQDNFSKEDIIQAILAKKGAITHGDMEGWVLREAHEETTKEIMTERLIARKKKPICSSEDPEERKDYFFWVKYCSPNNEFYDPEIAEKVFEAHSDWKI
ncbi:MAG: DEAD/DEAH box helicase family protein [Candidatus Pacearchaeota archaeon]